MKIELPKDVRFIIDKIYDNGHEAFIVGGCVRDSILGLVPNDYDITTSAKPNEILNIFKDFKIIDNGIKHGTVGIIINKEIYEITTYRLDGEYENNRKPKNVSFTSNLVEDLKRRDFTVNAIAYNDRVGIVDKFNGVDDIKNKIIKTVGNPDDRFNEDGLRLIRAVRFSGKLGFNIEYETLNSIYRNSYVIKNISKERITDEFSKMILGDNPQNIILLYKTGIFKFIEINSNISSSEYKVFEKLLSILEDIPNNITDKLAMLEFIIKYNKYSTDNIKESLVYSKKIKCDSSLISQCMIDIFNMKDKIDIKLKLNKIGIEIFKKSLKLSKIYFENECEKLSNVNKIINLVSQIEDNKECYKISDLNIDGSDIKSLGYKGKEIGEKLNYILNRVIVNPDLNKNEILKKLI